MADFRARMMGWLTGAGLMAGMVSGAHAGGPEVIDRFQAGNWQGKVYAQEGSESFSSCVVHADYQSGTTVAFGLNRGGRLILLLMDGGWSLPKGKAYTLRVTVDGKGVGRYQAEAYSSTGIRIPLGQWAEAPVASLRHGRRLTIHAGRRDLDFKLTDTLEALPRLRTCYRNHTGSANPFGEGRAQGATTSAGAPAQPGFKPVVRARLREAGQPAVEFVPTRGNAPADAALAWRSGDLAGFLHLEEGAESSLGDLVGRVRGQLTRRCDGGISGNRMPVRDGEAKRFVRARGTCVSEGNALSYRIVAFATPKVVVTVTNLGPSGAEKRLAKVAETFWKGMGAPEAPASY
jgi:hypothetical protein